MDTEERMTLSIHLEGTCADGTELSSASLDPVLLKRYLECWCKLTEKDKTTRMTLREGSLIACITTGAALGTVLASDIAKCNAGNYSDVTPDNRATLLRMTAMARRDNLKLSISTASGEIYNTATAVEYTPEKVEVDEEMEIEGLVTDAGGKNRPNIHIVGKSRTYLVAATRDQLARISGNILYKHICVRVSYKYNVLSDECDNYRLLDIVDTTPISKEAMRQLVDRESMLWKDVDNPAAWLAAYRGEDEA